MKKYILHIIIFSFLFTLGGVHSYAQKQLFYNGKIKLKPYEFRKQADSLFIKMDIELIGKTIEDDRYVTLTPMLQSAEREKRLPEVRINGKDRHAIYLRERHFIKNKTYEVAQPYAVVKTGVYNNQTINYVFAGLFEDWMEYAQLNIEVDICGCGGHIQQISVEKLSIPLVMDVPEEPKIQDIVIAPYVAFVTPPSELKKRSESKDVFLDFPVNKTNIIPGYGSNYQELSKIESVIREINTDKNIQVTKITIIGYASPEGNSVHNTNLSYKRAEALRAYLSAKVNMPYGVFHVEGRGEDWDGLAEMVENSSLPNKNEILSVIKYSYPPESRKYTLKHLRWGTTYQFLLQQFYPKLRRSVCEINYTVRGFSMEEARNIIRTQPHLLSLQEMYMVANSYPVGSRQFIEVFDTALKIYPHDSVANLNGAAIAMMRDDMSKALYHLGLADKSTPEYMNNLAAYYMLFKQYDKAIPLLKQASSMGLKEAADNMNMLITGGIVSQ